MTMEKKIKIGLICLIIGIVLIGGLLVWNITLEETKDTAKYPLENNLDPSKPTTDCAGNYLYYRDVYEYANILEKTYDMYELKNIAISKGFEVNLIEDWSYIDNWEVDEFNGKYELGFKLKKGDQIDKGPIRIRVSNEGIVKISGPRITVKKTISEEEKYRITLRYEPDYYLKQSIQVVQDGRCNFKDSYIKNQVKNFLKELNLESEWVDKSTVEINWLEQLE